MTARPKDLPTHAPVNRSGINSAFARRALGKREARRLAELMDDAERRARARFELANREVEDIFTHARAEAEALLSRLPDFSALELNGQRALRAMRDAADRHGLPLAVIVGRVHHDLAQVAQSEAVRGIANACPGISDHEIGTLLGLTADAARKMRREGK